MAAGLHPVLLAVPGTARALPPRERVRFLSRLAREAVRRSAARGGFRLAELAKDVRGAPRPAGGLFWSLAHKPEWVAGVVAPHPVGIDIEAVADRPAGLFARIARPREWALLAGEAPQVAFARLWTAKEAVLKASGRGLAGLADCLLVGREGPERLLLEHAGRGWAVAQRLLKAAVAAVTVEEAPADWRIELDAGGEGEPGGRLDTKDGEG